VPESRSPCIDGVIAAPAKRPVSTNGVTRSAAESLRANAAPAPLAATINNAMRRARTRRSPGDVSKERAPVWNGGDGDRRGRLPGADSNRRGRRVALAGPEYRSGPPAGQAPPRDQPGMGRFDVGSGTIATGIRPLQCLREHCPFVRPRIASASGPAASASVTDRSRSWRPLTSVRSTRPVQKRWTNSSGAAGNGLCAAVCRPVRFGVGCRDGQQTGPGRRKPSQPPHVNVPAATATTLPTFPAARRRVKKP
jgi:hypothetical protein